MKTYSISGSIKHIDALSQTLAANNISFKRHMIRDEWQQIASELIVAHNQFIADAASNPALVVAELVDC